MALIKCKECGTEISNKARTCIKCGAPVKKEPSKAAQLAAGILVLVIIGAIISAFSGSDKPAATNAPANDGSGPASQSGASNACEKDDLQCLGDKGVVGAGVYCKDPIERLAEHDVKWTDGTFEMKFSRFRWKDKDAGVITYVGDKAEFQNGFGAFTPVTYECDMASDNKTVLDARVSEGRLPK